MKKIAQGRYELTCSKEEAIERFQEMAGYCREELSDEYPVFVGCTRKGKIGIGTRMRRSGVDNPTHLYAQIVEEADKTYITYYTAFSKFDAVFNVIVWVFYLIMAIFAVVYAKTTMALILAVVCGAFYARQLYAGRNGKNNARQDSEIMIKVLEERVKAVNRWDE
ncbi:MAG: hypothetical protein IJX01_02350 [Oscillospiraceae bacterium]|nr:hypothetical protein [Oscillospiraceae bacterium]